MPRLNRRQFLLSSAVVFTGSLLGFHRLAPSHAATLAEHHAGPKLALIIDDIGFSRPVTQRYLDLQIPITFSILPRLPLSALLAEMIHRCGHEIMLHQPMEPLQADVDPGPGAVYLGDSGQQIKQIISDNITALPYLAGVNNHMGSRFTQSHRHVCHALTAVQCRSLYFVDSVTTRASKAFMEARRMALPTLRRDMFIDPMADAALTFKQLCRLKLRAVTRGCAIGIGHPYPETLAGLRHFLNCNAHQGIQLVYISSLLHDLSRTAAG